VRHYCWFIPAPSICAERSGTPCVGNSSPRSHHTGRATAALAARQAACGGQADTVGVWGDPRSAATIPRSRLSADRRGNRKLTITRTSRQFGDRFQCAVGRLWNRLPPSLRQPYVTYRQFTAQLKSHLFCWDCDVMRLVQHRHCPV